MSLRASPGGSIALSCHCTRRCVFVKLPSISGTVAAGRKNTSVLISAVLSAPLLTSGLSFQKLAVSVSNRSRTTSQSNFANAWRWQPVVPELILRCGAVAIPGFELADDKLGEIAPVRRRCHFRGDVVLQRVVFEMHTGGVEIARMDVVQRRDVRAALDGGMAAQ